MRRWIQIAHIALGTSGAIFFLSLTAVLFYLLPRMGSMLSHADQAAANTVTATGVIANASVEQEKQAVLIERDVRTLTWRVNRTLEGVDSLVSTSTDQVKHVGPLLDSMKAATDSVPPVMQHLSSTSDTSNAVLISAKIDLDDIHRTITDKRVNEIFDSLNQTSKHVTAMSASGDKILADGQYKAHQLLHPDKVKLGFWGSTWAGFEFVRNSILPRVSVF